ncbi:hypothetical protein CVT24_010284 [Panaeolus cyanescens]|uniref:Uncharacterized protein n=1 Tax=Panaeolus cyanescens TaxID=181874 RepID=A0A409W8Z3_9AGAR|nr:hypothetical protein CVT24_010284 [Panaeolus cyanescens]
MSRATLAKKNALPLKEAGLFKELLSQYENRLLKKGLKTAEQILKKFPEHGETLCMKGLLLTHMGRREEGIDLVKKGIRFDLTSHICWHVFGLIQKADKNYEEALRSYTQALRFDSENINLLRDSAQLQTQLRLFDNLVETRHHLLRLRPNLRQNWVALAVAYHLNGNLDEAKRVIEQYLYSLKNVPNYDVELSETLLYYVNILEQSGDLSGALSELDTKSKSRAIVDRTAVLTTRARLLTKLASPEAGDSWKALIDHNPDNLESYRGYLADQGVSLDDPTSALEAIPHLKAFAKTYPKASVPVRLQLTILPASDPEFSTLITNYLERALKKGVPSIFADLKALYSDLEKRKIVETIAENIKQQNFAAVEEKPSKVDEQKEPTTYLWTLYFLAQHYSYVPPSTTVVPNHKLALEYVNNALSHTPTLPELYLLKGRILKRGGDFLGAASAMNEARILDGQDRFLNTKAGKYLLRAGMVEEASRLFGMFTKKDAESPGHDLEDMQSLLFLLEEGDAFKRVGKPNLALKRYMAVKKIFDTIEDDQFDFHGYNLRKFTLNVYLTLLTWEDTLRSHPGYVNAAIKASNIFVEVSDDPSIVKALTTTDHLSDAEKKARKKAKKAAVKAQEDKKSTQTSNADKELEAPPPKDDDPEGLKLIASTDGLEQAAKLLQPLTKLAPKNIDVWLAIHDVAIRRKKLLQAVGALHKAASLDAEHPELHIRLVDLKQRGKTFSDLPAPVNSTFTEELEKLIPEAASQSLENYNAQYLQRHSAESRCILAAAKVAKSLSGSVQDVENIVFNVFGPEVSLDIKTALSALSLLVSLSSQRKDEFRAAAQKHFEFSTAFKAPSELEEMHKYVLAESTADGKPASAESTTPEKK